MSYTEAEAIHGLPLMDEAGNELGVNEGVINMKVEDIPRILGWMLSADRHLDHLKHPKPEDGPDKCFCTECLMGRALIKQKALIELRREKLESRYEELKAQSERLLVETGEKKLHYPGIGRLGYYKGMRKVFTTGWDELDPFTREVIGERLRGCAAVTKDEDYIVRKKAIKDLLKAAPDDIVNGVRAGGFQEDLRRCFSLSPETEFVDFRKER